MLDKCTAETFPLRTRFALHCVGIKLLVKTKKSCRSFCIAFFKKIFNLLSIFRSKISDYDRKARYKLTSSEH